MHLGTLSQVLRQHGVTLDLEGKDRLAVAGNVHEVTGVVNPAETQCLEKLLEIDKKAELVSAISVKLGKVFNHVLNLVQIG